MKKRIELPLTEPMYNTYHYQGSGTAILANNPSIRNWYLTQAVNIGCNRKFLSGFTSPELTVGSSSWETNPYIEKKTYPMQFLNGYVHYVIRSLLDAGYYVYFSGIDDYYVKGKSWYNKFHFYHDGLICGYDRNSKQYCIYAYDENWIYKKFWISQGDFEAGRKASFKKGVYGRICGIKAMGDKVEFSCNTSLEKISDYLDSNIEKYPENGEGRVSGIVVHDYIIKYICKLADGSIPYERMDRRIFRIIWEHKKVMLERICLIENELSLGTEISNAYKAVVKDADNMRMLYAAHHMKRRDSILPVVQKKLLSMKEQERNLLTELLKKAKGDDLK